MIFTKYLPFILGLFLGAIAMGMIRDAEASRVIYVFVERYGNSIILDPPSLK